MYKIIKIDIGFDEDELLDYYIPKYFSPEDRQGILNFLIENAAEIEHDMALRAEDSIDNYIDMAIEKHGYTSNI